MKKTFQFFTAIIVTSILCVACEKEETTITTVSTDEIAEDLAVSISSTDAGITGEMTSTIALAEETADELLKSVAVDTLFSTDSSFVWSETNSPYYSYNYALNVNYGMLFENGPVYSLFYHSDVTGSFDGLRISSVDDRESDWKLSGFENSANEFTLIGSTLRNASSLSKVGNMSSISSKTSIEMNAVKFDKNTLELLSGTLNCEISGSVNATSFKYSAKVVYMGDGIAEITIEKSKYTVDLESGEIID
nr:hypothetical protein [uncultured Carboxylicivirga sp.]